MRTSGLEVAQHAGKCPWARHGPTPAAPTSRLCSEQRPQPQERPGHGGLRFQRTAEKLPLPQCFTVASGQKLQLALIRAPSASPSFQYAPRAVLPSYRCHVPSTREGRSRNPRSGFRLVFYFKLQEQRERCETEMGMEQVPATGEESSSLVCCVIVRHTP